VAEIGFLSTISQDVYQGLAFHAAMCQTIAQPRNDPAASKIRIANRGVAS